MQILYLGCLATNLVDFLTNLLLYVAMVTKLVKKILQNVWLYATDSN